MPAVPVEFDAVYKECHILYTEYPQKSILCLLLYHKQRKTVEQVTQS